MDQELQLNRVSGFIPLNFSTTEKCPLAPISYRLLLHAGKDAVWMQTKDGTEIPYALLCSSGHKMPTPSLPQVSDIDISAFLFALFLAGPFSKVIQTS